MPSSAERALAAIRRHSQPGRMRAVGIDVHFHPDAVDASGATVLERLALDGRWRTQFETRTSNGGLTAFRGGDRWRWESRLFDGAYDEADARDRPVYGALRREEDPYGAAPRFGSGFLRLRSEVLQRSSLCFPDSAFAPDAVGTVDRAGAVLDALGGTIPDDPLDRYVEVHVHGGLDLRHDVEAVVLDPGFRRTAMADAAVSAGLVVQWHPGYVLPVERIPELAGFRGPEIAVAACRVARDGSLTPADLGAARRAGSIDPPTAKKVWHLLAAFGRRAG